ncbi:histidinol-phosphate transaminase [Oceanobacillus massiliensis]|uniref:histidinol-phosphate transaminase n=1 Tax=Oceanobacillus massiliensis TaxID=1465765 RepID=UPI00028885DA|nr:histidinol-phosphate transaminase [Oceanobacillus massiliensis]
MEGKPVLTQLSPYKQGKQTKEIQEEYGLDHIVKLASNENPYGYSEKVRQNLIDGLPEFNIYPDGYTGKLRESLSLRLNFNQNQFIFGSGTEEIIQMLCRSFLVAGSNVIMAAPTFPQYKHYALIEGAAVKEIPTNKHGYHDLERMLAAIDEKTKIVWLCSPNNPTGTVISDKDFESFMNKCPKHVVVAFDEAYYEFMDREADVNALSYINRFHNLIVMRTFSKAYGLAGLRIGYGIANEQIVTTLDKVRGPFNTTSIAQFAAVAALEDQSFIEHTYDKNKKVKAAFETFLDTIGWEYYDSETNFLLVHTPVSGMEMYQYLVENGFIIRPGELLGIPGTIRVSIGTEQEMEELQRLLLQFYQDRMKVL